MAVRRRQIQRAYGVGDPTIDVFPVPIAAERAPTANDKAQIGTIWVDLTADNTYILASIKSNIATWVSSGGGAGTFNTLTVTNDITSTNGDIMSGNNINAANDIIATGDISGATVLLSNGSQIIDGVGDPNGAVDASQGSLFLRLDGSSTTTRAYINTDGATAWTSITTAA